MEQKELTGTIYDSYPDLRDGAFLAGYNFETCYTRTGGGTIAELDVAAALLITEGNLSETAKLLKRDRRTIENFIARNLMLKELIEDIEKAFLDIVEQLHRSAALKGDLSTQRFFLTTKGKDRGYVTRNESTGKDGERLVVEIKGADANL